VATFPKIKECPSGKEGLNIGQMIKVLEKVQVAKAFDTWAIPEDPGGRAKRTSRSLSGATAWNT
jgi:hypothetical protein